LKRGIYLVANFKSQGMCGNLIYSIRQSGCNLPIRLIHFGGEKVQSAYILKEVELLCYDDFPVEAKQFVTNLRTVITDCPLGYLYRYLAWYSDWDEFIYSDNDIVALLNWECFFDYLKGFDLVHADEEYTTKGRFNYHKPKLILDIFGKTALESAITAGHFAVRRNSKMIDDINQAIDWFRDHPDIPQKHDQSLLHVAALLGKWEIQNLCKPPNNWLSSWAGDYSNSLKLIQILQSKQSTISHLHYSGGTPIGNKAIHEFLYSVYPERVRLVKLVLIGIKYLSGYYLIKNQVRRAQRFRGKLLRYLKKVPMVSSVDSSSTSHNP
jgi:hypothetical protein